MGGREKAARSNRGAALSFINIRLKICMSQAWYNASINMPIGIDRARHRNVIVPISLTVSVTRAGMGRRAEMTKPGLFIRARARAEIDVYRNARVMLAWLSENRRRQFGKRLSYAQYMHAGIHASEFQIQSAARLLEIFPRQTSCHKSLLSMEKRNSENLSIYVCICARVPV